MPKETPELKWKILMKLRKHKASIAIVATSPHNDSLSNEEVRMKLANIAKKSQ